MGGLLHLLLLVAGGDGNEDPVSPAGNDAFEMPRLLTALVPGCGAAVIHDDGHIVYLTVPSTCEKGAWFART